MLAVKMWIFVVIYLLNENENEIIENIFVSQGIKVK